MSAMTPDDLQNLVDAQIRTIADMQERMDALTQEKAALEQRLVEMAQLHAASEVAKAVAEPAAPAAAVVTVDTPTIKQLAAQLDSDEKWTIAEQKAFAPFLAQFPNESSWGILSLGSAWKHGIAYEQSLSAAPQQHAQAALSDEQIEAIYLANGFTVKEGHAGLKAYVFRAARAILAASQQPAAAPSAPDDDSRVTGNAQAALSKAQIDDIVYQCRQSGNDTTYDIVAACIAAMGVKPALSDALDALNRYEPSFADQYMEMDNAFGNWIRVSDVHELITNQQPAAAPSAPAIQPRVTVEMVQAQLNMALDTIERMQRVRAAAPPTSPQEAAARDELLNDLCEVARQYGDSELLRASLSEVLDAALAAPAAQVAVPDLHDQIMRLSCDVEKCSSKDWVTAFKEGHRYARHAAAELAAAALDAAPAPAQATLTPDDCADAIRALNKQEPTA